MKKAIIGKKLGMTQVFTDKGEVVPVTVIEAGPCTVVQKKTTANDGYSAVQVGFVDIPERKLNKPEKGHFQKAGQKPKRYLKELRLENADQFDVGQEIRVEQQFAEGDIVDVSAISRGHGYSGGVKRWGFHRGLMSHGSKYHRGVGSLSSRAQARVFKNRKMPGQYGAVRVTIQNLKVVRVDAERNLLLIRGSVPGVNGAVVTVKSAAKA